MVDGFDTTIPFILQWMTGMLCVLVISAAGLCFDGNFRRGLLRGWSVLSGLSRPAELQCPDNRLLQSLRCVAVPMRTGPPLTGSPQRSGDARAGEHAPRPRWPAD